MMDSNQCPFPPETSDDFDLSFKVFHELMARKVTDILLISSPYEAFIMEEEGRLAERIIHEYRGLNLSRPPMLTWVSTGQEALAALRRKKFDLVITMPLVDDTDAYVPRADHQGELPGAAGLPAGPQERPPPARQPAPGPRRRSTACTSGRGTRTCCWR